MYIMDKKTWIRINSFLTKSFRPSSIAVLDDGRIGLRVNMEPELLSQVAECDYIPEKEYPIHSEPEHVYNVNPDIISYVEKVAGRYLYGRKTEGNTVRINANSDTFSKIVARAYCEKRSEDEGVNFITEEEASNRNYIITLFDTTPSFAVVPIHVAPSEFFSENAVSRH